MATEEQAPRGKVIRGGNGKSGLIVAVFLLPILFGVVSGAVVYYYLKSNMDIRGFTQEFGVEALEDQLNSSGQVISALETRLAELEDELGTEGEVPDIASPEFVGTYSSLDNIQEDIPVVSWDRPGLLSQSDRDDLQARLIDPYFDYHNGSRIAYIAMIITVPATEGEPYEVRTIHRNGGGEGFFFGRRGEDSSWWYPECLGECDFSSSFSAKYPEIVATANGL